MAIADNVLLFGRLLRAAGLEVHHGRLVDAIRALDWWASAAAPTRATLRSLLVHRHEDIARFDQAFDLFFRAHRAPAPGLPLFSLGERPRVVARAAPGVAVPSSSRTSAPDDRATRRAGGRRLEPRRRVAHQGLRGLHRRGARTRARAARRTCPGDWACGAPDAGSAPSRGAVDLRPLLRRNLMRGGDFVDLPRRQRRETARPIVLIARRQRIDGTLQPGDAALRLRAGPAGRASKPSCSRRG